VRRVWWVWVDGKAGCSEAKKEMRGAELVKWLVKSVFWPLKESRKVHGGDYNSHGS
jgi:hypothetical protein